MEASTRVIPLLHHYPVSTEPEEMWEHGNVLLAYRLNQLRYDLRKLKGHGLLQRDGPT